jgi:hypothetical protein
VRADLPASERRAPDQDDRRPERLTTRSRNVDETLDDGERVVVRKKLARVRDARIVVSRHDSVKG